MSRLVNGTIVIARVGDMDIRGMIEDFIIDPTGRMYDVYLLDGTFRTVRLPHFLVETINEFEANAIEANAIEAKQTHDQLSPLEQTLGPLMEGAIGKGKDEAFFFIPEERNTVPVCVTGVKAPHLPFFRYHKSFEVQGSASMSRETGSKIPVRLTPMYCRPSPTSLYHYELFGNCVGKSKDCFIVEFEGPNSEKQLQLVLNDREHDFVKLQTEEQILYQQIQRDLLPLAVTDCTVYDQKAEMRDVIERAWTKQEERLVLLRSDFSKCTRPLDFLHIQAADHAAIKSHLDFVESSTFLKNAELDPEKTLSVLMSEAHCKRVAYFKEKFVAFGAKHHGSDLEKDAESFLRDLTTPSGSTTRREQGEVNRTRERNALARHDHALQVLGIGIERRDQDVFTFPPKYKGENRVPGLMEQLSQRLKRAIEGSIILALENQTVQIARRVKNPDKFSEQRFLSENHEVKITGEFLGLLPRVAKTMVTARELDTLCFSSCLNFQGDPKLSASHAKELSSSQMVALLDFSGDPGIRQVIELIQQGLLDGTLKKYLKYKMKYLNLKKQLNLQ